jgi:hypothetical protein
LIQLLFINKSHNTLSFPHLTPTFFIFYTSQIHHIRLNVKKPPIGEVFYKGAKRWSFRNWLRMVVIQELAKNSILALVFAKAIKGIKNGKVRINTKKRLA